MNCLKPNEERGKRAITMIWIVMICDILSILVNGYLLIFYNRFDRGDFIFDTEVTIVSILQVYSTSFYLPVYVISGVTFIMWFRRAYYNLNQLTYNSLKYSDGWAVGSWFVPFLNLYRPYKMMKEMYVKTNSILYASDNLAHKKELDVPYVGIWWTLLIISILVSNISLKYDMYRDTISQLSTNSIVAIVEASVGIVLALITIMVMKDYCSVEPLLAEIGEQQNKQEIDTVAI